jgi:5-hydroxyisourate hydrolase
MRVTLERRAAGDAAWSPSGGGSTDVDGRIHDLTPSPLEPGVYRLTFDVDGRGDTDEPARPASGAPPAGFFPEVSIVFRITEERHYHVPLLLSPFAYSTYRGS